MRPILALPVFIRGLIAGFIIAAPVGPVNVLCMSRTLAKGKKSGLISGVGAAAADTFYGAIAGFSISFIIELLVREEFWIRLFGGLLLVLLGIRYYFKPPQHLAGQKDESSHSDSVSAFLLNLTNPTTVLSFLAVLAALGLGQQRAWWESLLLVGGIFWGSMLWWMILVGVVMRLRDRFDDRAAVWMNRIAGIAIGGFGLFTAALSRHHPR